MFCTHSSKKQKEKGRKRAARLQLETRWHSSGSLSALQAEESPPACPCSQQLGRSLGSQIPILGSLPCAQVGWLGVPPQAPAFLSLFQSEGHNLQRRECPFVAVKPKLTTHHPEKREGSSPKGKMALPSRHWREASLWADAGCV